MGTGRFAFENGQGAVFSRALVQFAGLSTIPSSGELKAVRWLSS
jgi:hypothetical protein